MTLTRTQMEALTTLHRQGASWPRLRGRLGWGQDDVARYSRATLDALVTAGLAQWHGGNGVMSHVRPTVTPSKSHGVWDVMVPDTPDSAAVARAIITGAVWHLYPQAWIDDYRARVVVVSRLPYVVHYQEA